MRLHVLSDLHFDVRRNTWSTFASRIPSDIGDVLVLAGDVLCMNDVAAGEMLASLRQKAREVVYVLGNHEHFHGVYEVTKEIAADICKDVGVHLLDGSATTVAGPRFIGGTLWFPLDQEVRRYRPGRARDHACEPGRHPTAAGLVSGHGRCVRDRSGEEPHRLRLPGRRSAHLDGKNDRKVTVPQVSQVRARHRDRSVG